MTTEREKNWENIFAYDQPAPNEEPKKPKCTCGHHNCRTAKHIKCTCRCHSEFHAIENRRGMEPLDKVLGLERETPKASWILSKLSQADLEQAGSCHIHMFSIAGKCECGRTLGAELAEKRPELIPWLEVC